MAKKSMTTRNRATNSKPGKPRAANKQAAKDQAINSTAKKSGKAKKSAGNRASGIQASGTKASGSKASRSKASAGFAMAGSTLKASTKGRAINLAAPGKKATKGLPGHQQDPKRRLGNFTSMGEHARVGGRTSGIVGQTTKDFGTDNKRTKSTKPRTKHGKGSR